MSRRADTDPMADYGKQLHQLLTEAMALARQQQEVEVPDPDAWQRLAQKTYSLRSALPSDDTKNGALHAFALELEHTLLARSRLESRPPQRVMFVGQTLIQARRAFDDQMTERLMPLAAALADRSGRAS